MDGVWPSLIVSVISGLGGYYFKPLLDWFISKKKEDAKNALDINSQAVLIYKDIVNGLKASVTDLQNQIIGISEKYEKNLAELEQKHLNCQKENARLTVLYEYNVKEIKELRREIQQLRSRLEAGD